MSISDEIRRIRRLRARYDALAHAKIATLVDACKHARVVVTCSAYKGSYSYDYDDGHEECRLCVDCGAGESGPSFERLLNPARRFEFGGSKFHEKMAATPLGNLMETPAKEVWSWVMKNGYAP